MTLGDDRSSAAERQSHPPLGSQQLDSVRGLTWLHMSTSNAPASVLKVCFVSSRNLLQNNEKSSPTP